MTSSNSYFDNIQSIIKSELLKAQHSVYIAVAWFTDKILFDILLNLKDRKVKVYLCVVEDTINFKNNGLPFQKLNDDNKNFFAVAEDKMHHKFCVIDKSCVITGSYNWTFKAANSGKRENIMVIKEDEKIARKFIEEFYNITNQPIISTSIDNQNDLIVKMYSYNEFINEVGERISKVKSTQEGKLYIEFREKATNNILKIFLSGRSADLYDADEIPSPLDIEFVAINFKICIKHFEEEILTSANITFFIKLISELEGY